MSKMPLAWHKKRLQNSRGYEKILKIQLDKLSDQWLTVVSRNNFSEQQIAEAEREGKDGFDADRYMAKKK